ncbi:hypothetical protein BAE44_0019420 [Dichanthelium oligosanthes]|uniref:Uncharacterized protein n=1 Tax=Dichanthelium oligosanthes TaxID=888268 RepID=A0A1E5V367_9POAL|nr:hypothetical protein BAE44_0019420 [Dichanthelium oligosanthes]
MAEHRGGAGVHDLRDRPGGLLFLDAGRVLMLLGALVAIPAAGNPGGGAANSFTGFIIWILGVCLLTAAFTLTPAARRFPRAARAVAGTVLKRFLPPVN